MLECATVSGARALQVDVGSITPGMWADFVSFKLSDPHLAGTDDESLLAALMFSSDCRAVADVFVGGELVVEEGHHTLANRSYTEFSALAAKVYE